MPALASLAFHGWWDLRFLPLLLGSAAAKLLLGRAIATAAAEGREGAAKTWLMLGVAANLGLLGFFKYADFFLENAALLAGGGIDPIGVILPIGISFFTFQQIAYLVDVREGKSDRYAPADYALFVAFFPQLIAGPIVHHREMMPQFARGLGPRAEDVALGLTIFAAGLFKKTVLADNLAGFATPVFAAADAVGAVDPQPEGRQRLRSQGQRPAGHRGSVVAQGQPDRLPGLRDHLSSGRDRRREASFRRGTGRKTEVILPMLRWPPHGCPERLSLVNKLSQTNIVNKKVDLAGFLTRWRGGGVKIGYARVSTLDQTPDLQHDALIRAGCEKIFVDQVSGSTAVRPGLDKAKEILRAGDTLVVWRLDRLGRSLQDLIAWAAWLAENGVALQSLQEVIDTSTSTGRLTFHLFGALAEFERNLIRERTQAGLAAARARGRLGGRPKALDPDKRDLAVRLYDEKKLPIAKICAMMGISKPTLYAYVRAARA